LAAFLFKKRMNFKPISSTQKTPQPIGRFAPSPSGPLHLGSLVTALGSYLQAKKNKGVWLIRIDDIDPPREQAGSKQAILECLNAHGLKWDSTPLLQSTRSNAYEMALSALQQAGLSYFCECTRKQIKQNGANYTGVCRFKGLSPTRCSQRFVNSDKPQPLVDLRLGQIDLHDAALHEDFIIKRKDGLYAYHLASVVDDIDMGITEVVRGADLLIPTACQLALYQAFDVTPPKFVHLPVICSATGIKLSKQNYAKALNISTAKGNLLLALSLLDHPVDSRTSKLSIDQILQWAIQNWSIDKLKSQNEIVLS
jgi:glutamyl-Q tRNA(Asp) synthetase